MIEKNKTKSITRELEDRTEEIFHRAESKDKTVEKRRDKVMTNT